MVLEHKQFFDKAKFRLVENLDITFSFVVLQVPDGCMDIRLILRLGLGVRILSILLVDVLHLHFLADLLLHRRSGFTHW